MAEKRGQYKYQDDGTIAQLVSGEAEITTNDMLPMDLQSRRSETVQTHAAVSILAGTTNTSAWIDSYVDGSPLTTLAVTVNMTSGTGMVVDIGFSHDGVTYFSAASASLYDGVATNYSTTQDIQLPARYFRVGVKNKDATVPKTTTAYAYLKV